MLKTLLAQVREFKKASFLTPFFMILEVLFETLIPLAMASIIDKGVEAGNIGHIYRMGGVMVVLALCGLWSGVMGGKYGALASTGFARNLRKAMYTNIQTFSFSNIDKYSTAGLITRLTTDVTNLQNAYQMILRMCTRAPASLICAMVMAFLINAKLASIYLIAVIFLGACLIFIMRKATKYFQTVFRKYDDLNASVQENIGAIRVVKAYVREDYEISKFQKACNKVYEMFLSAEKIVVMNMPLMQFTVYACILGISWLGAKMIVGSTLTTGELMSLLTYCMNILMSLMMLSMVFVMVTMSIASAERVTEVINDTADITDPENPVTKVPDGSIVFDHVNFSYKKDSKEPVLKDINLSIRSGETIGIIGGTGSGKSTLVDLIARFYDASSGTVILDGQNVQTYSQNELREKIGVVPQKAALFQGTIRENLSWGREDATDEEMWEALTTAQAREIVEKKEGQLDFRLEQNGRNLSGGQRQRLTIARALVKKPEILILDDSASALDFATDAALRKSLHQLGGNTTTFLVSQRAASIRQADLILVLDDGQLAGKGTHQELVSTCETYREIFFSQFPEERIKYEKATGKEVLA